MSRSTRVTFSSTGSEAVFLDSDTSVHHASYSLYQQDELMSDMRGWSDHACLPGVCRNPRLDPQPGDILLGRNGPVRVIRRRPTFVDITGPENNRTVTLDTWTKWAQNFYVTVYKIGEQFARLT